ncbi:MAG: hypothetical protein JNL39_04800 [Opitutaceae bacterium]|nr:hypothetical protein [Opitutaceae bacterium]
MHPFYRTFVAGIILLGVVPSARATDPSGIWSWTQVVRGVTRESKLTLILKGKRVVGSLTSPGPRGEHTVAEVLNGVMEFDVVSFSTERDINGHKYITKYRGKVLGTLISGTVESTGSTGLLVAREWTARRLL